MGDDLLLSLAADAAMDDGSVHVGRIPMNDDVLGEGSAREESESAGANQD